MSLQPHEWSIVIAVGTVIVVPMVIAIAKKLHSHWDRARQASLDEQLKKYVTTEELEMQFDTLQQVQTTQHAENKSLLDAIRMEAIRREERLTTVIHENGRQVAQDLRDVRGEVKEANRRIDGVLPLLGDRRRPRP